MGIDKILDKKQFHHDVEEIVWMHDVSYMEALQIYQESAGCEAETVAAMVKKNPILKAKLQEELEKINMVDKLNRLPF